MKRKSVLLLSFLVIGIVIASHTRNVDAADHGDPSPRVSVGDAGDIGDVYLWHSDGTMKAVVTFAGPVVPGTDAAYSRDILYTLHIDGADTDNEPDLSIHFRFATNDAGAWGVWAENLPGADADVVGEVDTELTSGTAMLYAGQRDDPFFFDLQGFQTTAMTGNLSFDPTRDFFAGKNINAIVMEFPLTELGFAGPYNVWATTGSTGG